MTQHVSMHVILNAARDMKLTMIDAESLSALLCDPSCVSSPRSAFIDAVAVRPMSVSLSPSVSEGEERREEGASRTDL